MKLINRSKLSTSLFLTVMAGADSVAGIAGMIGVVGMVSMVAASGLVLASYFVSADDPLVDQINITVSAEYTKVAHKNSATDMTESTGGVKL